MAVAYFFVIFCCFVISLLGIVMHSAKYFKQGFTFNEYNKTQYFELVFCYWDFSLKSAESVNMKRVQIINYFSFIYFFNLFNIHSLHLSMM